MPERDAGMGRVSHWQLYSHGNLSRCHNQTMAAYTMPDLTGWEAFCDNCKEFRHARCAQERDASDGTEYFEFLCVESGSILLTFQRVKAEERTGRRS